MDRHLPQAGLPLLVFASLVFKSAVLCVLRVLCGERFTQG
jgi:hypothetical protein